jgi:hypothetical protein
MATDVVSEALSLQNAIRRQNVGPSDGQAKPLSAIRLCAVMVLSGLRQRPNEVLILFLF